MTQANHATTTAKAGGDPHNHATAPRRGLLGGLAAAAAGGGAAATALPPGARSAALAGDAELLTLARLQREAERAYEAAVIAADLADEGSSLEVDYSAIEALAEAMANTPAASLLGAAAKARRLCDMLATTPGGSTLPYCYAAVAESLAADLERLAPETAA